MPSWTTDEITALTSDGVLSVTAEYIPFFGMEEMNQIGWDSGYIVDGLLSTPFEMLTINGVDVESGKPEFICSTDDLGDAFQGDWLIVSGVRYEVVSPQPAGTGMTRLILRNT